MLEFRKKKKIRKIIYSPTLLFLLFIIFLLLAKSVWGVYQKDRLSRDNLEKEQRELKRLEARESSLASSIEYLKTEAGVEAEIRTKFRAVRDNEMVAVIIDDEASTTPSATTTPKRGFWYRLFHL